MRRVRLLTQRLCSLGCIGSDRMVQETVKIQLVVHRRADRSVSMPELCSPTGELTSMTYRDDALGHAKIRQGLKGIMGVATGEHAHNRRVLRVKNRATSAYT